MKLSKISCVLLCLSLFGCGNWSKPRVNMAEAGSTGLRINGFVDPSNNGGFPADTTHDCTKTIQNQTTGGADDYKICVGKDNSFNISIHGSPSRGKAQVCVFPLDVLNEGKRIPTYDTYGRILYRCMDMSTGYNETIFSGARFNAAAVVQSASADSMGWCLQNGNPQACPAHAYERWNAYDVGSPAH